MAMAAILAVAVDSLRLTISPDAGRRGLAASRPLKKGEMILSVPKSALSRILSAKEDPQLAKAMTLHPTLSSTRAAVVRMEILHFGIVFSIFSVPQTGEWPKAKAQGSEGLTTNGSATVSTSSRPVKSSAAKLRLTLQSLKIQPDLAQDVLSSILPRECGAAQEGSLPSTFLEESTSQRGRRTFSTSCLLALAAFPFVGRIGEAQAEDAPPKQQQKKKGRAPSSPYDEDRLLQQNRRMQRLNNAPSEFPGFVREGFQVKVIATDKYVTSKSGLIYYDMVVGTGDLPQDGQQVIFHYTGYNESGRRVDSSYQQGRPARTRVGIQGMIPGFEEGIKTMRPGGRRIIIVPPELGPPVGPSTFFSAKQFEVFDVELFRSQRLQSKNTPLLFGRSL